jgi:hypothetical protein
MILDNLLTFTGQSNGGSAGISQPGQVDKPTTGTQAATNVIDLGLAGIPTSANGGGARDIGTGDDPSLKLSAIVTTTFTGGTSLGLLLSGAPDNGSGAPGSYTVMWQSPAVVVEASLLAGAQIANIDVPRPALGQPMPRFLQLSFVSVGTHTAGLIEAQIVIDRDDQVVGTTGAYSGYPAGLNVAN